MPNFTPMLLLADGSYGPLDGALIIAIPRDSTAEDIEEIIDAVRMSDHNTADHSEGFVIGSLNGYPSL